MRRAYLTIFILTGLILIALPGFCAPVGNPNDLQTPHGPGYANMEASGMGVLKLGGDVDFVFKKELKGEPDISDTEVKDGYWYLGKVSYTMMNRFEVFGLFGATDMEVKWKEQNHDLSATSTTDFAWGVGGKLFIYEVPEWKVRLTANGLYRRSESDVDKFTYDGSDITSSVEAKKFVVSEWQAGATLSREFKLSALTGSSSSQEVEIILVPYVGGKYSETNIEARATYGGIEYSVGCAKNDKVVGVVVGGDLLIGNNLSLNAEGRFVDETALSAGLTIKL